MAEIGGNPEDNTLLQPTVYVRPPSPEAPSPPVQYETPKRRKSRYSSRYSNPGNPFRLSRRVTPGLIENAPQSPSPTLHLNRSADGIGRSLPSEQVSPEPAADPEDTTLSLSEIVENLRDSVSSLPSREAILHHSSPHRHKSHKSRSADELKMSQHSTPHKGDGFLSVDSSSTNVASDNSQPLTRESPKRTRKYSYGKLVLTDHPALKAGPGLKPRDTNDPFTGKPKQTKQRSQSKDWAERLPRDNFDGHRADRKSRRAVTKACLWDKDMDVKAMALTKEDAKYLNQYTLDYAKGVFNMSKPLPCGVKLSPKNPYFIPPTPINEFERLRATRELGRLERRIESDFLEDAVENMEVASLTVSIMERLGELMIGSTLPIKGGVKRERSFASHAILTPNIMEVMDLTKDWRFEKHPFVLGGPKFRYFAAAPILHADREGQVFPIGTCAIYSQDRQSPLTPAQRIKLQQFAVDIVMHLRCFAPPGASKVNPIGEESALYADMDKGKGRSGTFSTDSGGESEWNSGGEDDDKEDSNSGDSVKSEEEIPYTPTRNPLRLQQSKSTIRTDSKVSLKPVPKPLALDSRVSSVIFLPSVAKKGPPTEKPSVPAPAPATSKEKDLKLTRGVMRSHPKGLLILPVTDPGNWSPEIRFVAHELSVRLGYGLLFLMRVTPKDVNLDRGTWVGASNYSFEILASAGMRDILTKIDFVADPIIPVRALQQNFGVRHEGHRGIDRIDAAGLINCVLGLVAPVKREVWNMDLTRIEDPTDQARARVERCIGGIVIAGYHTGIPNPDLLQNGRDEIGDLCGLAEAGTLMYEMLREFRPGSDYDPVGFGKRLAEKDKYFKGFQLVGDNKQVI